MNLYPLAHYTSSTKRQTPINLLARITIKGCSILTINCMYIRRIVF